MGFSPQVAQLEEFMSRLTEQIYWRSLPSNCRIKFDSNSFYFENCLVCFFARDEKQARRFLKTRIRA